jgi:hypothetical protein
MRPNSLSFPSRPGLANWNGPFLLRFGPKHPPFSRACSFSTLPDHDFFSGRFFRQLSNDPTLDRRSIMLFAQG